MLYLVWQVFCDWNRSALWWLSHVQKANLLACQFLSVPLRLHDICCFQGLLYYISIVDILKYYYIYIYNVYRLHIYNIYNIYISLFMYAYTGRLSRFLHIQTITRATWGASAHCRLTCHSNRGKNENIWEHINIHTSHIAITKHIILEGHHNLNSLVLAHSFVTWEALFCFISRHS